LEEWPIWRLVLEGTATLQEIECYYDLDDVIRANDMLDVKEAITSKAQESVEKPI